MEEAELLKVFFALVLTDKNRPQESICNKANVILYFNRARRTQGTTGQPASPQSLQTDGGPHSGCNLYAHGWQEGDQQ